MANPIGEAFITLRPDLSKFQGEAGAALSGQLTSLGGKFSTVGRLFTVGVSAPIIAGFALSAKAAIDFESAYAGLVSKVQGSPQQLQTIADGARQMSKELPFAATEILGVAKNAGQLGVKTDDVLKFTRVVLQMAQTTNLTADEAGAAMARIANILGLGGQSFDRLGSTILALGNIGASTEKDIVDMALRIAGAGKVVGLSAPEVLAFANALSTVGLDAESGGTAISRAFVEMANAAAGIKPTEEQLKAIDTAQRAVRDSSDGLVTAQRGVRDSIEGVRSAYDGVEAAHRTIRNANETLSQAYRDLAKAQRDQTQAAFDARRESLTVAQAQQHLAEVQARSGSALLLEQRDAQLAVAEAQKGLAEAQTARTREVADAQRALSRIQAQAKPDAQALADAQRRLTEAQSKDHSLEIARATQTLNRAQQGAFELSVRQKGASLEVQSAQLAVEEAQNRVGSSAETQADKIRNAQKTVRTAVEGVSDARKGEEAAQIRVRDALEGVTDAQKNEQKAKENWIDSQKKVDDLVDGTTGKLKLFATVAGTSAEEFAAKFKVDAAGAMVDFINGLDRMQKEGINVFPILDKLGLGEIRVRDALLRTAGAQGVIEENLRTAAKAWTDNTELERQAAIMNETTAAKIKILKNEIVDVLFTMGKEWLPVIRDVIDGLGPLAGIAAGAARAFANLPGPVKIAIVAIAGIAAAVGVLLIGIGLMLPAIGAMIAIAPFVGAAFTLMLGPVGLVILAIAAITAAIYLAIKNWDSIGPKLQEAGQKILDALGTVLDFVRDNWKSIAVLLLGPFALVVAAASDTFGVRTAAINAFNGAKDWLYNAGKAILNGLLGGLADKWQDVKDFFGNITDQIPHLKGPESRDLALLAPAGRNVMQGFQNGLDAGWGDVQRDLSDKTAQLGAMGSSFGGASPRGLAGATGSGGGGGGARSVAVAGKSSEFGGGITINATGPIVTNGKSARTGLRNLGWGVQADLNRRGVYTP